MDLRCVGCGGALDDALACAGCGACYPRHASGKPVIVGAGSRLDAQAIAAAPMRAKVDLAAGRRHWRAPRLEEFLAAAPRARLLSHGCGDGGDREFLVEKGFEVTSFDIYPAPSTDVIADGHAIPFADASFDTVASIAVIQCLHDPFLAAAEIGRVLRDGGHFVGTVAFLERHQDGSHFHMTHLGVREILERAGMELLAIDVGWSWLEALAPNFWVWNRLSPSVRNFSLAVNGARYQAGLALTRVYYALRGRPLPDEQRLAWAGAFVFHASRRPRPRR